MRRKNIPVVSGLAFGIDCFSHKGCLEGEGKTLAVLACGPEMIYPRSNKKLAANILESGGCILSEYAPGTEPLSYRFPERNRIISGLSRSVLIVEAPKNRVLLLLQILPWSRAGMFMYAAFFLILYKMKAVKPFTNKAHLR